MPDAPLSSRSERVDLIDVERGQDVIVDGRRVPMLEAHLGDGGRVLLVFDRRIGIDLSAENYVRVTAFVADVMKGCFEAQRHGPVFPQVFEISSVEPILPEDECDCPPNPSGDHTDECLARREQS